MATIPANKLTPGDTIDTEPIFEYFSKNGYEYNDSDRMAAECENETVESVTTADNGNTVIITTSSVFYSVPAEHPVTVTTN